MSTKFLVTMSKTRSQGIEYAAVYDREFYMQHNQDFDLKDTTDEECFKHFLEIGMMQGRAASAAFDPAAYYKNYPLLKKIYGTEYREYYIHYLKEGMREGLSGRYDIYQGKCYQKVFDVYYYCRMNPDVVEVLGDSLEKYIEHFVEYGMNEGRMARSTFDVHAYKYRYERCYRKNLESLKKYYEHYLENGEKDSFDGRCTVYGDVDYALVYSYPYYKANNDDVRVMLGENASLYIQHFAEYGMQEGRSGNGVFDVFRYKAENPEREEVLGEYLPLYYLDYIKKNGYGDKK